MSKDNNTNIILPDVLSINASDSTGEAGIVADIGTISALRGRPLATMTSSSRRTRHQDRMCPICPCSWWRSRYTLLCRKHVRWQ